jgi:hypothetical protein
MKQGYLGVQSIHSSTYIAIYSFIYIHYNLFISFIYSIDQNKGFGELTSVCRQQRFPCAQGRAAAGRRPARAALTAAEETSLSDVDGGGIDSGGVESGGDLESFVLTSKMARGGLLFIGLKISAAVLWNLDRSGSGFKPLLMKVLSVVVPN